MRVLLIGGGQDIIAAVFVSQHQSQILLFVQEIIGDDAHKGIVFYCIMRKAFLGEILRDLCVLVMQVGGDLIPLGIVQFHNLIDFPAVKISNGQAGISIHKPGHYAADFF